MTMLKHFLKTEFTVVKDSSRFPYRYIENEIGNPLPIVVLTAFFRSDKDKELYYKYIEEDIPVIGMTAYKSFPLKITDISEDKYHLKDTFDYLNIPVWLYCMDDHERYGLNFNKHFLLNISESDFYDIENDNISSLTEKKYDFIYVCNKDSDECPMTGWNAINRNYALALRCFPIMVKKYGLKGLCVGRIGCDLSEYGNMIETTDFLPWADIQQKMRESKFLFVPNIYDASPRVVAECITKGLPVLMNRSIICGSKYITPDTGELFTDEHDIHNALNSITTKSYNCKLWWTQHYGIQKSGKKLAEFIKSVYPDKFNNINFMRLVI
jgi:hypothetical protein